MHRLFRSVAFGALCLFVALSASGGAKMATVSATAKTSTGTQDITISGFGTPVAAIVVLGVTTLDGTATAHLNWSIGFTDGTGGGSGKYLNNEDNVADSDTASDPTSGLIQIDAPGDSGTNIIYADFNAWVTDGIQIDWQTVTGDGERLFVVLFGGDIEAKRESTDKASMAASESWDITSIGFQSDLVFFLFEATDYLHTTAMETSFGAAWDSGSGIVNRSWQHWHDDGIARGGPELSFSESDCIHEAQGSDAELEASDFDSNGFTLTNGLGSWEGARWVTWLALRAPSGESFYLDTYTNPTSSGNDAVTAPGFVPQCVLMATTTAKAVGQETDADAASCGVSAFDGTREYSIVGTAEDNEATMNTQTYFASTAMSIVLEDGTVDEEASFVSFDVNGFTLNWPGAPGDARKHWYLALEEEISGQPVAGAGRTGVQFIQGKIRGLRR